MMLSDVRKDKTFQSLNKDISSDLKKLDKLESNLQKSLLEHKLGILSGGLTEDKYNKMVAKISESDLTAKQKEKIFNQMHKIREARMKLGDKFKQVGLKDNNDFSALGDTPKA
jgi:plastocyanin domain-containing protein